MGRYQAVFFDRDGTLSTNSTARAAERDAAIGAILGRPDYALTQEANMAAFWYVREQPGVRPVNTLAKEDDFWRRWYRRILEVEGATGDLPALAEDLYSRFCFHRMMEPYPETEAVLQQLWAMGFVLGVISDTYPSLELSLRAMGLAGYFQSFTASSLVGVGKPDPRIFRAATDALGVEPQESVFVDDTLEEVEGARVLGFTAFHIVRTLAEPDFAHWRIGNLQHLLQYPGLAPPGE